MAFTPVQKLSITTGAAMVLLSSVGLVAYLSTTQLVDAQRAASETNTNIALLDRVLEGTVAAEAAVRLHVQAGDADSKGRLDAAQADVEYALDSLRVLSEDHPAQRRNLDSLGPILGGQFRDMRQAVLLRSRIGADSARGLLAASAARSPARLLAEMRNEELRVLGERTRVMADSAKLSRQLIVAGSVFALLLALVALQPLRASVGRRLTERLSQTVTDVTDDQAGGR